MAKSSKRKKASRKATKAPCRQTMRPIDLDLSGGPKKKRPSGTAGAANHHTQEESKVVPSEGRLCSIIAFQTVTPGGLRAPSIFRKHAVDAASKRACVDIGRRLPTSPPLKKTPG